MFTFWQFLDDLLLCCTGLQNGDTWSFSCILYTCGDSFVKSGKTNSNLECSLLFIIYAITFICAHCCKKCFFLKQLKFQLSYFKWQITCQSICEKSSNHICTNIIHIFIQMLTFKPKLSFHSHIYSWLHEVICTIL